MVTRSHLSIGEVLSLLREEFPDVTISKIRFLESQGLVDPERTPSGYRKFYDHDVERLRWILRQQREHFLPLKVIKGRLNDHGDSDGLPDEGPLPPVGAVQPELLPTVEPSYPPPWPASAAVVGQSEPETRATLPPTAPAVAQPTEAPVAAANPAPGEPPPLPSADPPSAAAVVPEAEPEPAARPPRPVTPPPGPAEAERPDRMSLPELAATAGIEEALAAELQDYGLLGVAVTVAGVAYYDELALEVGRIAGGFATHGVEVRHLRAWRNAADREASLFEQLVLPLLHQRNPQARQQAADTLRQLDELGGALRAVLVRRALDDIR